STCCGQSMALAVIEPTQSHKARVKRIPMVGSGPAVILGLDGAVIQIRFSCVPTQELYRIQRASFRLVERGVGDRLAVACSEGEVVPAVGRALQFECFHSSPPNGSWGTAIGAKHEHF